MKSTYWTSLSFANILSLGTTPHSGKEKAAVAKIETTAMAHNIPMGDFSSSIVEANAMRKRGYYFFAMPSAEKILRNSVNTFFQDPD